MDKSSFILTSFKKYSYHFCFEIKFGLNSHFTDVTPLEEISSLVSLWIYKTAYPSPSTLNQSHSPNSASLTLPLTLPPSHCLANSVSNIKLFSLCFPHSASLTLWLSHSPSLPSLILPPSPCLLHPASFILPPLLCLLHSAFLTLPPSLYLPHSVSITLQVIHSRSDT